MPNGRKPDSGWFSVRCLFMSYGNPSAYEERITVWRASDLAVAIERAEREAAQYAADIDADYIGLAQAYAMVDGLEHGAEVFSLIRESDLGPDDYVQAFFNTGSECQQAWRPTQDDRARRSPS